MATDQASFMCNGKSFQTFTPEYTNAVCPLAELILGVIKFPFLADLV